MLSKAGIEHLAKHLTPASQIVMRADFNVPIKEGKVTDPNRIKGNLFIDRSNYSYHRSSSSTYTKIPRSSFAFGST